MNESRAAIRYARAILDLAVDNKSAEAVETDMHTILQTVSESPELRELLASPVVDERIKRNVLADIFKGSNSVTTGLFNILIENKRISLLEEVALKYLVLYGEQKGEGVAYVTTAVPLSADMEAKLLKKIAELTPNKVTINNKVDKSIVGGFVLRIGDLQYDASISSKLSGLKREFSTSI
tara:strand:- start:16623 stop:17162 length:540 start_codon:yes stop_codon:yes gene_type:complete